jgi:PAS domain S-box-containing protein
MSEQELRHTDGRASTHVGDPQHGALDDITAAWQQAKDAFEQSERRYRNLVEHSLGLICTHDLDGRLLSINPAAARSLGYEAERGIGRNLAEFLSPETRHLFDGYLQRIRDNGQDAGLMRVIARDGGARVWMYRNVLYEPPGDLPYILGHAIDITERIVAERTLRENEQALRRAHDELDRHVKERTVQLERANEQLRVEIAERERAEQCRERALIEQRDTLAFVAAVSEGLAPVLTFGELVDIIRTLPVPFAADWTMLHLITEEGRIRSEAGIHLDPARAPLLTSLAVATSGSLPLDSLIARVIATERLLIVSDTGDLMTRFAGPGDAVPVLQQLGMGSVAILPLVAHGQRTAALSLGAAALDRFAGSGGILVEDLARRVRLALDRIQLYREAQEANRLKDEFLSTLSHELRTPLNAVFGWARILRLRQLDGTTAHAVEVIERNAEAQIRLIEDVLDVSRIITGKMTLSMEAVDVGTVLGATIDAVRPAMEGKGVRLESDFGQDVPSVFADRHRLQQVFWNVLSNAVKFTGTGGVITVTLRRANSCTEVQIGDSGVGIRRDVLPFVFDRFRQADSSPTRRHGGLGLGLAIVRHLVELHGGTVDADSPGEGHGATFTIRLPIDRRARASTASETLALGLSMSAGLSRPLHGRKVLVVEDHDDARDLVACVLGAAGAEVTTAASTREALTRIAVTTPDLLLADLGLPDEDGYTLLRRIRAIPTLDALPAVALTAYARASDRERALAAGFLDYVIKPVDPQELVKVIVSVIEARH